MKRYIPNALTLLNLFCGCIAVFFAANGNFLGASLFMSLGIFFDFFDGFAARKLNVQSELGIQLDSLADMVTSGLVPGMVIFRLLKSVGDTKLSLFGGDVSLSILPLFGFLITIASAYRLAKFNLDIEQQDCFKGLPTPANAILIVSLPLILAYQSNGIITVVLLNKWFLIGLTIFSCWILNANVKLFALKFKTWNFKDNATRYIFILLCVVLLIILQFAAIPIIILLYIAMSVLDNLLSK